MDDIIRENLTKSANNFSLKLKGELIKVIGYTVS